MKLLPARVTSKPQYVLHPGRALRRVLQGPPEATEDEQPRDAHLPWGLDLSVYASDAIGYSILTGVVFDPCVTEALHRLIDPGDTVVDVGANVGYLTGLAATRAGSEGKVLAYEPHPEVFGLLSANVERWREQPGIAEIELHQVALSDSSGTGELAVGPRFRDNMGLAAVTTVQDAPAGEVVGVDLRRLDDALPSGSVGLLKIDVEGHEPAVLRGAARLLESGAVRDIVFEDHDDYPSDTTRMVEAAGYRVVHLDNDLFGLRLVAPEDRGEVPAWPGPSYLATRDYGRALERLRPRGWRIRGIGLR